MDLYLETHVETSQTSDTLTTTSEQSKYGIRQLPELEDGRRSRALPVPIRMTHPTGDEHAYRGRKAVLFTHETRGPYCIPCTEAALCTRCSVGSSATARQVNTMVF